MTDELPQGWGEASLGEIAETHMGETILANQLTLTGIPVYSAGQANDPWGFLDKPRKPLGIGTIVVSARGSIGFPKIPREAQFASTQTTITLSFTDDHFAEYVCYWLKTVNWGALTKGGAIPMLTVGDVNKLIVPIASEAEQKRIVARLEKLLNKVESSQKRMARIPNLLKRFRQSVLAAACSGALTVDWREDNPDTKATEQKGVGHPPTDFDLPVTWSWMLSDYAFGFITSGSRGWARYYSDKGSLFLRVGNLNHDDIVLDLSSIQRVSPPSNAEGRRTKVISGDILISITADVGMIALVESDLEDAFINQHVALARPVGDMDRRYLAYFLAAKNGGQRQFLNLQRGATKVGLGLNDIRSIWIAHPPFLEQQEIVRRVEKLLTLADKIEARFQNAQVQVDKLTQSILAKAFRGELVPQDPSDEPAEQLLKRIKSGGKK